MLILRGNSDPEGKQGYPDEKGEPKKWPDGALHEQAAKDYATCRGYVGDVLDVSGDALPDGNRDKNPQTFRALCRLKNHDSKDWKDSKCDSKDDSKDEPYSAIYGFSGGGYDVLHILNHLNKDELKRIKLVVVLGAPPLKVKDSDPPRYYPRSPILSRPILGSPRKRSSGSWSTRKIKIHRSPSRRRRTPKNTCSARSGCSRQRKRQGSA
jgi:hypothetical protein